MMFACFFKDCWGSQMLDNTIQRGYRVSVCGEIKIYQDIALHNQKDLEQAIDTSSIIGSAKTEGSLMALGFTFLKMASGV